MLVAAALDGHAGADRVDKSLERAAIARLVAEERRGLTARVEPALLTEFGRRLDNGGADAVPVTGKIADGIAKALREADHDVYEAGLPETCVSRRTLGPVMGFGRAKAKR